MFRPHCRAPNREYAPEASLFRGDRHMGDGFPLQQGATLWITEI
jgi:hypothetical protein